MNKTLKDAEETTPAQLKGMTPVQVDELFAAVWDERYNLKLSLMRSWDGVLRSVGARKVRGHWDMEIGTAERIAHERAAKDPKGAEAKALEAVNKTKMAISTLVTGVLAKLDFEFDRRGGWNRCYLVTDGHAHRTMHCSTCNNGEYPTRFSWMIDYSGKNEKEIVEAAGDRACSVCYPSAPVNRGQKAPTSILFTQEERDRDADRERRAARKKEIADKKAAKAITDADGGPLTVYSWTQKAHQKQTRNGVVDVPERVFTDTLKTVHAARSWLTDQFEEWGGEVGTHRDIGKVADAVALKEGKDRDTVIAEARKRAAKRK